MQTPSAERSPRNGEYSWPSSAPQWAAGSWRTHSFSTDISNLPPPLATSLEAHRNTSAFKFSSPAQHKRGRPLKVGNAGCLQTARCSWRRKLSLEGSSDGREDGLGPLRLQPRLQSMFLPSRFSRFAENKNNIRAASAPHSCWEERALRSSPACCQSTCPRQQRRGCAL